MNTKIANTLIVGLVLIGTIFLGTLARPGEETALLPTLFLGFFAAIIVIQLVPAVMLVHIFLKQAFRRVPKDKDATSSGQ